MAKEPTHPSFIADFRGRTDQGGIKKVKGVITTTLHKMGYADVRVNAELNERRIKVYGIEEDVMAQLKPILDKIHGIEYELYRPENKLNAATDAAQAADRLSGLESTVTQLTEKNAELTGRVATKEQELEKAQREYRALEEMFMQEIDRLPPSGAAPEGVPVVAAPMAAARSFASMEEGFLYTYVTVARTEALTTIATIEQAAKDANIPFSSLVTLLQYRTIMQHPQFAEYESKRLELAEAKELAKSNKLLLEALKESEGKQNKDIERQHAAIVELYAEHNQQKIMTIQKELVGTEIPVAVTGVYGEQPRVRMIVPFVANSARTEIESLYLNKLEETLRSALPGAGGKLQASEYEGMLAFDVDLSEQIKRPAMDAMVAEISAAVRDMENPLDRIGVRSRVYTLNAQSPTARVLAAKKSAETQVVPAPEGVTAPEAASALEGITKGSATAVPAASEPALKIRTDRYYTVSDAAELLGLTTSAIYMNLKKEMPRMTVDKQLLVFAKNESGRRTLRGEYLLQQWGE